MSHSNTEFLIDYWQKRSFGPNPAARSTIDPADFPTLLPQVFILGRHSAGLYGFRLSGGLLRDLHGRDLRGADFTALWTDEARIALRPALEDARLHAEPLRLKARAVAEGYSADLEITLMPLSNDAGAIDRMLGLYQPVTPLARLRGRVVEKLVLLTADAEPKAERGFVRLAAVGGQRVG
jgi:hypothetical protein